MNELILGGARSGKSRYAEKRALQSGLEVIYIATATAGDAEMSARIQAHRVHRPSGWQTQECPLHLAATLQSSAASERCLLVDCMTLWLSNILGHAGDRGLPSNNTDELFAGEKRALIEVLPQLPGQLLLVSNEIGQGLVPADALSRRFRDEAGWLNQELASCCDRVTWITAGLSQTLKGSSDG